MPAPPPKPSPSAPARGNGGRSAGAAGPPRALVSARAAAEAVADHPLARSAWEPLRRLLPEGGKLPEPAWTARHEAVVALVGVSAFVLWIGGIVAYRGVLGSAAEAALPALCAALALRAPVRREVRAAFAGVGLVMASTVLVSITGGLHEAHAAFLFAVVLVALYQAWLPFLATVGTAFAVHLVALAEPRTFYNSPDAIAAPLAWALLNGVLLLVAAVLSLVAWRLHESAQNRANHVLAAAGLGVVGVSASGRITFANPAAARMMGFPLAELLGRPGDVAMHPRGTCGRRDPACLVARALRGEAVHHAEVPAWRRDGARFHVECSAVPTREKDLVTGAVLTLRDTTERHRMQAADRLAQERLAEVEHLKEADRFKTQFLNMAAHELNTPITPILLQLELLRMNGHTPTDDERRRLELLERNVGRLSELVRDILDVSRMHGGRLQLEPQELDLAALVREAGESYHEPASRSRLALRVTASAALPVRADPKRVMQVLFNLLSNALKFTPPGGAIAVEALVEEGDAVVRVRDTGRGFSAEQAARLFQPFSQVHDQEAKAKGSGLGLYICKGIVEQHGGTLGCESAGPGKGATFWFRLPLATQSGAQPEAEAIRNA